MRSKKVKRQSRRFMAFAMSLLFIISCLSVGTLSLGAERISNPDRERVGSIDGIDPNPGVGRHNSYAWAGEVFQQTDGEYLWVGMNRDLGATVIGAAALEPHLLGPLFNMLSIPLPSQDRAGRIYRQRASDPDAPWELMHADTSVSGFRRMILFNDDLYVIGGTTNTPIANYSSILRFPKDFRPGDRPEVVIWETLPYGRFEHFRAATVFEDRLYIGSFDSRVYVTDGTGLQDLTPMSGDNMTGWELAFDLRDFGIGVNEPEPIWDILGFNGSIYAFTSTTQDRIRGFRVVRLTPGPEGYEFEEIVGGPGSSYPFGMGVHGNIAASGFLSTSFGQDYVYVSTFAAGPAILALLGSGRMDTALRHQYTPAQIFRFGADDRWEVVVGDTTGPRVARNWQGQPVPHVGNQRAGFSILPDDRFNTSFNQYIWWMAEHQGRLYATTWNMANFREHYAAASIRHIDTIVVGSGAILIEHADPTLGIMHYLLARDHHLIDFGSLAAAVDAHLLAAESLTIESSEQQREVVQGIVNILSAHIQREDFRHSVQPLTDIIMDVIEEVGVGNQVMTTRQIAAHIIGEYAFNSRIFGDVTTPLGFALYVSEDGMNFEPVSINGFGDPYNYGGRVLVPSDHGLYLLTANPFYGGQVWRTDQHVLGLYPNAPTQLNIGRGTSQAMTVLVRDAGTAVGSLSVSHDSELVDVRLTRRPAREISQFTWDHEIVFDPIRNMPRFEITETETRHQSVLYDVSFTALRAGQQNITLEFELDGVSASSTIDLTVYFPGNANRAALSQALSEAGELNRSDFTQESWGEFLPVYINAMGVYNNSGATQAQVNQAATSLNAAVAALVPATPPAGFTVITTEDQLRRMTRRGNYWLANDIELTRRWTPIASFVGTFDGNGRTIRNLEVSGATNQGMFRRLDSGASVRDVEIVVGPAGVRGTFRVGALAGLADNASIMGVRIQLGHDGVVGSRYVGGLVGRASRSAIIGSFVYGSNGMIEIYLNHPEPNHIVAVRGNDRVRSSAGGLAGELNRSMVSGSASYVNVTGYNSVGGFVGSLRSSVASDSFARGHVVGRTQVSAAGRHSRGERIGGFIGVSFGVGSMVENVYSAGVVLSNGPRRINPFIGQASGRLMTRGISFYDRDVALNSTVQVQNLTNITASDVQGNVRGGLLGESRRNMMMRDTFTTRGANWDFNSIWTIGLFNNTPMYTRTYPYFIGGIALASRPPMVRTASIADAQIAGIGNSEDATIRVEFPDGTEVETTTDRSLEWSVDIPLGVVLYEGDEIVVTQKEVGLPESEEITLQLQVERPIDLSAHVEFENLAGTSEIRVGNTVRYSITIFNNGCEDQRGDRLLLINSLPAGVTFVASSVRLVIESANGDEVRTSIARNTSGIATRGHSFNAATRNLEIRLGDLRLYGDESVTIEFDVTINSGTRGASISALASNATMGRITVASPYNIITATASSERFVVE